MVTSQPVKTRKNAQKFKSMFDNAPQNEYGFFFCAVIKFKKSNIPTFNLN